MTETQNSPTDDGGGEVDRADIVYVRSKPNGGNSTVLHTNRDCPQIQSEPVTKHRSFYPDDTPVCSWCACRVGKPDNPNPWSLVKTLESTEPGDIGLSAREERQ